MSRCILLLIASHVIVSLHVAWPHHSWSIWISHGISLAILHVFDLFLEVLIAKLIGSIVITRVAILNILVLGVVIVVIAIVVIIWGIVAIIGIIVIPKVWAVWLVLLIEVAIIVLHVGVAAPSSTAHILISNVLGSYLSILGHLLNLLHSRVFARRMKLIIIGRTRLRIPLSIPRGVHVQGNVMIGARLNANGLLFVFVERRL